jgi:adenosylcobinamide kinase/adenosylcobinamide-phosphate guanylyltransferase
MGTIHLVTGGVKSGKSRYVLQLATEFAGGSAVRFIATAHRGAGDDSLDLRIDRHVAERPGHWTLFEPPTGLVKAVGAEGDEVMTIVDCVTLWVGDLVSGPDYSHDIGVAHHVAELVEALRLSARPALVITNEVGSGVAPPTVVGNDFADELGNVNRLIADASDRVTLLVAGQPLQIKPRAGADGTFTPTR